MKSSLNRRQFIKRGAAAGASLAALPHFNILQGAVSPGEKVVLGVMGANGRGSDLIGGFSRLAGVEIGYVCDVDERAIAKGFKTLGNRQAKPPQAVKDFRRILDDRSVDALVIAAPDHWHGPATILACAAGKHVYVEKPACHNPHEGELMIAAARK